MSDLAIDDGVLDVRDGELWFDEVAVAALAAEFGTPLFVLSERRLRENARTFRESFSRAWPGRGVDVLPSIKANYVLAARRILTEEGLGCDTFGPGELYAAERAGVPPELVSVNGSAKSPELIRAAIEYGARITLDGAAEARLVREVAGECGRTATVRVRMRPDYSALGEASDFVADGTTIRELAHRYKPGIPTAELVPLGRELLAWEEIDFNGLMFHIGRHKNDLGFWREVLRAAAESFALVCEAWNWEPEVIDIGGGFATRRDPTALLGARSDPDADRPAPTIAEYGEAIPVLLAEAMRERGLDPTDKVLEIEPGRSMFADTGLHLTTVRNVKRETLAGESRAWVETDTTEMFLTDGMIEQQRFRPVVAGRAAEAEGLVADVVGMSCQFDIVIPDAMLASGTAPGDVIAIVDSGAYLETSASNFNALPRPATVLVDGDRAELVKRAESVADVFGRDIVPDRLLHEMAA
jgi:diaminopimelate decarboxylase